MNTTNTKKLTALKRALAIALAITLCFDNIGRVTAITYDSATSTYFDSVDDYGLSTGSDSIGLQFGGTLGQFLRYSRTIGRFVFSDDLDVQGTISGWSLRIMGSASISGTLALEGSTTLSGAALRGFGLNTDCDTAGTSKLLWDATTGRFSCGTDQGASYTAGQGLSLNGTTFSTNATLTGTLLKFTTATGSLVRFLTVSGATVYAKNTLVSSGTLVTESNATVGGDLTFTKAGTTTIGMESIASGAGRALSIAAGNGSVVGGDVTISGGSGDGGGSVTVKGGPGAVDGGGRLYLLGGTDSVGGDTFVAGGDGSSTDGNLFLAHNGTQAIGKISIGTSVAPKALVHVQGILSGVTLYATKSFSGAGLTDCSNGTTSKLLWNATTGRFSCGTDQTGGSSLTAGQGLTMNGTALSVNATLTGTLLRFLTVSGSTVFANNRMAVSGALVVRNGTTNPTLFTDTANGYVGIGTAAPSGQMHVYSNTTSTDAIVESDSSNANVHIDSATNSNASMLIKENGGIKWSFLNQGTTDNFILSGDGGIGTDDFITITQTGNMGLNAGASTTPKAKLAVAGTISGTSIYAINSFSGAGLTSCSNATTSKLLWNATTGRFSCGTDQDSGGSGGGMSYATASGIFLKRSGGTMTGTLKIQNGNTHSDTTTPLLTVLGTMSGKGLAINNGGFFRGGNGDVNGDGSQAPADLLAIINYLSGGGTSNLLTPAEYARADVNGDGRVDYFDYYMISNYSLMDASENAIAKYTSDSAWTLDLNKNLSIGTSTPEAKLDVVGTISGSALNINGEGIFRGNVGVGTINNHSTFTASGSFATRARIMTATGSINGHDNIIFASGSSMISVTLPTAVGIAGRQYTVKKTSSPTATDSRPVIVKTTSSETIDRLSQWRLTIKNQEVTVVSDGSNWQVFNGTSSYGINGGYMAIGTTMNQWYGASADATALTTAVLTTTATIRVLPFVANRVMTINGMSVSVQTTAASAEVRVGLYNDNGRGYPDQLVVDAGTVSTTSTGQRTICPSGCTTTGAGNLPTTIQPGLYWIAINNNSIAHTLRGYAVANLNSQSGFPASYTTLRNVGWQIANSYAALPSTFPSGATATTAVPLPAVTMRMQE